MADICANQPTLIMAMKEIEMTLLPRQAPPPACPSHAEQHVQLGHFLKSFIYGGLDSTINILTIILSATAIQLPNGPLVAVAVAATMGEAIGMGLGDYISYQSEQEYVLMEREREEYEFEHMREEEVAEMVSLLRGVGFGGEESQRLTKLYSSNSKVFIDLMMMTELGLVASKVNAWQIGLVNFSSFLIAGALPLLPYILAIHADHGMLVWSAMIGVVQLFALGYVKGMIIASEGEGRRKSGLETLMMGAAVTIIGAFMGSLFGM